MRSTRQMMTVAVLAVAVGAVTATATAQQDGGSQNAARIAAGVAARTASAAAPAPWLQGDPADSVYRAARAALNRSQYRRAIELFSKIRTAYPGSGYVGDAHYWEAFAHYRIGAMQDLKDGLRLIDMQAKEYPDAATRSDAEVLATRIRGRLAQRGDAEAAERLAIEGGIVQRQGGRQGAEDEVKLAALQALMMMESEQALPVLRDLILRRDATSVELRRRAIVVLGQHRTPETEELLLDVIRNDPDPEVRTMALMFLADSQSEEAFDVLADAVRSSDDPELQRRAVMLLAQHGDPRGTALIRDLVRQPNADPELVQMAVVMLGQTGSAADRDFLKELYSTTSEPELREYIVHSMAVSNRPEDRRWLLDRARDPNEAPEVRQQALFMAAQDEAVPVATIIEIYDSVDDPDMRAHLLFALSHRNDKAAIDKLMEVAQSDPDPEVRQQAVMWLGQSKDPRVAQFLLDIINK